MSNQNKLDEVPGLDDYLRRVKEFKERQYEMENSLMNTGFKYTGKPTNVIPFNLNQGRRRVSAGDIAFTSSQHKLSSSEFKRNQNTKVK